MVIYRKLLPQTKKRGVFYLSLKISSLNRLASYDEYPPGVLVRTRKRYFKPALPTILLANVQSIDNKMDELNARIKFQWDIRNLAFVETWLVPEISDTAVTPSGFSVHRQDRTADSGKRRGEEVCVMVNFLWATDIAVLASHCSPVLELLTVKIRPFYLQWEFTAVVMSVVYIPPSR